MKTNKFILNGIFVTILQTVCDGNRARRLQALLSLFLIFTAFQVRAQVAAEFKNQQVNFQPSRFFETGVEYSYKAGSRGFGGGKVKVEQKNEILHFTVKIRFLGAGTFSRTNLAEVVSISQPMIKPSEKFFVPNLNSFSDNPILAQKIQELVQTIEKSFSSPQARLKIIVEFGKDSDYLGAQQKKMQDNRSYLTALRKAVDKKHPAQKTDAVPVSVISLPEPDRASPSEWDLYSDPRLFAHELFHVIGTLFEGYECDGYPPNGIMQDGSMMAAVDQYGEGQRASTLLLPDLLEFLSDGFSSAKMMTPEPKNLDELNSMIESHASSSICAKDAGNKRIDYLQWSDAKRAEAGQSDVLNWLK